ncbi:hypothetical protein KEH51_05255 [[Brevibacterium] frigoritolerans]|uniref:Uncharacterized protein n=1 Tax=Peribacillus frigoritolerans TaxID=450367 RepID=A0A941FMJ7_9BACI|nr:hypothetical protein [Peribacillus frigoritolerans]
MVDLLIPTRNLEERLLDIEGININDKENNPYTYMSFNRIDHLNLIPFYLKINMKYLNSILARTYYFQQLKPVILILKQGKRFILLLNNPLRW